MTNEVILAAELAQSEGWQSMDTMPYGQIVLLCHYNEDTKKREVIAAFKDRYGIIFGSLDNYPCALRNPLCWQPLPLPPKELP